MVPQPESVAQRRFRELAAQNAGLDASTTGKAAARKPPTTYGKRTNPPCLTASQFFRRELSDTSFHDEEDELNAPCVSLPTTGPNADDRELSPLSDADSIPCAIQDDVHGTPEATRASDGLQAVVASTRQSSSQRLRQKLVAARSSGKKVPRRAAPGPKTKPSKVVKPAKPTHKVPKASNVERKTPAKRRLPMSELLLVHSPPQYDHHADLVSSPPDMETRDPIRDRSSPRHAQSESCRSSSPLRESAAKKTPLTSIRKRLRTSDMKSKVVRKPKGTGTTHDHRQQRPGDGFEPEELRLTYHVRARKHQRRRKEILREMFGALQLHAGPLPEVVFEPVAIVFSSEPQGLPDDESYLTGQHGDEPRPACPGGVPSSEYSRRRVSFSDRNHLINLQLASVHAPARSNSDSEAEESDEDHDEEDDEEIEPLVAPGDDIVKADLTVSHGLSRRQPFQAKRREVDRIVEINDQVGGSDNAGVTLDFRTSSGPGMTPKPSMKRRRFIEVDEAIIDAQDETSADPPRPSDHHISTYLATDLYPSKPRSILKNSTPAPPGDLTRPENTAANTRRNSTGDAGESSYFAEAASHLSIPDTRQHIIIPRRRSSRYFEDREAQVVDSERVVPETSPEPANYAATSQLDVLRHGHEAVWTSQIAQAAPKDLKTLTRQVSRGFGTESQAVRRKRSLAFQSPMKVR